MSFETKNIVSYIKTIIYTCNNKMYTLGFSTCLIIKQLIAEVARF